MSRIGGNEGRPCASFSARCFAVVRDRSCPYAAKPNTRRKLRQAGRKPMRPFALTGAS